MATTFSAKNSHNNKCGVIVFRKRDNKFLIVKNKSSGFWGFPKGHQESGENVIDTAIRELHEEAGISIKESDIIYSIKKRSWFLYVVILDDPFVKIDNYEICDFKWVDFMSFTKYNTSKGTAMFLSSYNGRVCELKRIEDVLFFSNAAMRKKEEGINLMANLIICEQEINDTNAPIKCE